MFKRILTGAIARLGYTLERPRSSARKPAAEKLANDILSDTEFMEIYGRCRDYTMTSLERMHSLYLATKYIVKQEILGDVVECGVWRGGSSMMAALTLMKTRDTNRKLYLYDTFTGMSEPRTKDVDYAGLSARKNWLDSQREGLNEWAYASLEEVKRNVLSTGYPVEKIVFVKGKVEDTIPTVRPDRIAILRLDTDWYESTHHELRHLFPVVSRNGVIIIDDYGHWKGCREAVDQYFTENRIGLLLNRIDYTGRIGVKTG